MDLIDCLIDCYCLSLCRSAIFLFPVIQPNDLQDASHVALRIGIIFITFEVNQPIFFQCYNTFTADTLRRNVTLTFDLLILNICSRYI